MADNSKNSVRVLLCEDSIVSRMIAEAACERFGCRVSACADVESALRLIGPPDLPPPFDLVLTDMHLVGESGLDLIRTIRAMGWSGFRLPVAVMTAQPTPEDEKDCHEAGGQFVLAKPLSETVLGEIIDRSKPLEPRDEANRILQDVQLVRRYQRALIDVQRALECAPDDLFHPSDHRTMLIGLLHELAGVGSFFGNPDLAARSNELEAMLRASLPDGVAAYMELRGLVLRHVSLSVLRGPDDN